MKRKILITDDDPGIQDIFKLILEREGYEVHIEANGNELLKNKFVLPDLFIIDKQLSGIDGLEICKFLKTNKRTASIPVILVSANPLIQSLANEAGVDNYLEKPFEMKALLRLINKYAGARRVQLSN